MAILTKAAIAETDSGAEFSPCGRYRYLLWRRWGDGPLLGFTMLNPSTADHEANDPTVERCCRRAREYGFGGLAVTNLFALRSTDPAALKRTADPVGPDNDAAIVRAADACEWTVAAWGTHGSLRGRSAAVLKLLAGREVHALKLTASGVPCHPLYLGYDLKPFVWMPR